MNKQQLIEIIAEENEITKDMATRTLNTMIRSIMTSVKNGEPVVLVGFGTFRQVKRKARVICNPHTGEKLELKPRSVPFQGWSAKHRHESARKNLRLRRVFLNSWYAGEQ